ncbi:MULTISPECIES: phage recombination protein Bet [Clostridium]|jgi:phage recombination protein Bet|uniref:RecT family protein n=1 Tax=Clostridium butyricum TaxID=1492 RepID=A0A6N3FLN5_CLOBU|nr:MULTISPECIES: phage recombination protein Bet [Clostridium]AXB84564.1 phage recombination protein Bet [Clostridium butyricum]MDU1602491.1 phage recombination protein Bet [Clostridium sp.]MDU4587013.1 phage recombination protein Bet [Clostridium sp.]
MADIVKYEANGQQVELSVATVKQYLVSGGGNVSNQEVMMFMKLCQGQKLNPFTREAYLVKYGNQSASIVVGKDAFTRRAEANPNYKGVKSGVIVVNLNKQIENREGTFYLKGREELVGGWARVSFKDNKDEVFNTVSLDEYIGRKKDGSIQSMWATKPATMIRKVALVQALRDAFPNSLSQMYVAEEVQVDESELPVHEVDVKEEQRQAAHVDAPPQPATQNTKAQVMQLAREKELMAGEGRGANVEALEKFANEHGISLRGMTEEQAEQLVKLLMEYTPVQEVPEEDIQQVEVVDAEVVNEENTQDPEDDSDPF